MVNENNTEAANLKFLSANIFYCHNCNIPIIQNFEEHGNFCPLCTSKVVDIA